MESVFQLTTHEVVNKWIYLGTKSMGKEEKIKFQTSNVSEREYLQQNLHSTASGREATGPR